MNCYKTKIIKLIFQLIIELNILFYLLSLPYFYTRLSTIKQLCWAGIQCSAYDIKNKSFTFLLLCV